ncbi:alpha-tubulin N-acetyltransferase 1 isoform X1 [Eupeodes corollae]|uniref:alpha-tubulin N-acetyltransferase 1 isoform X1 n=1 Tax=Eupeodes corollae TaxID=290404 RepID=UPI002492540C|nr:alpha-tubulin N-acetyltransferase 1 isoform X1 [Eupeodes corollae]XP_055915727.1 alpha-tubulin N-acetyltransferase 1 isoform X1 [Eupeodes corollae]XP_055915728.1 alpha-tubulin N-acetyltransferase 1 isoform X1 [Eupeodes corollae]XP_055915729.1 alpha-tubulin N-acetyltransferase 1 isoform X1 [Eupeodes corollae]
MVEFRFDIKPLFPQPIVKITSNLLPHTFRGDRRMALDTTSKMSEIIDTLGELSATSQKLSKAVTTSQRLRMSDNQKIYLLADVGAGHNGAVIGLLKVGTKSLYLFDESGETKKVDDAPCILDFYIHESRQRAGLGKDLFEAMLAEENWAPIKLSIDRPSEKLLGFLKKHYGLEKTIPQSNNFVLYEGFFGSPTTENNNQQHANGLHITDSPNTALFGPHFIGDDNKKRIRQLDASSPSAQVTQISPVGRYAAPRPSCSMAEIIHSSKKPSTGEAGSTIREAEDTLRENNIINSVCEDFQNLQTAQSESESVVVIQEKSPGLATEHLKLELKEEHINDISVSNDEERVEPDGVAENLSQPQKPSSFQLSKQHTGLKNISFNVGMAVTPTKKMEFDQEQTDEFGIVKINRPPGKLVSPPPPDNTDAMSTVSSGEGFTDQGYYDLKFYHNKLW